MSKPMNVEELIAKLQAIEDKSLPIVTMGCDCDGEYCGVEVTKDYVYITRDEDDD